ncbi:hypothetical protein PybrP1_002949 [[Pythium] brassicae (nom. inval.)]|nr:hypothetical protein PybrP1_002949 [[Pythium] brassicae (nom. inval.)]
MEEECAAAVTAVICPCVAPAVPSRDQHSVRAPSFNVSTFAATAFEEALVARRTLWFNTKLRCDRAWFLFIVKTMRGSVERLPSHNSKHNLLKRVALTITYLSKAAPSATLLLYLVSRRCGPWCTSASAEQLVKTMIAPPGPDELHDNEAGFSSWTNVARFARSSSDLGRTTINHCGTDLTFENGMHLLGDAGYKVWCYLLTPFAEEEAVLNPRKRKYNHIYSKTRTVVECAFGWLKSQFRILLGKLKQNDHRAVAKVVVGCTVFHNLFIVCKNSVHVGGSDPLLRGRIPHTVARGGDQETEISHHQGIAKRDDLSFIFTGCTNSELIDQASVHTAFSSFSDTKLPKFARSYFRWRYLLRNSELLFLKVSRLLSLNLHRDVLHLVVVVLACTVVVLEAVHDPLTAYSHSRRECVVQDRPHGAVHVCISGFVFVSAAPRRPLQ